jgi:hypothetical protein
MKRLLLSASLVVAALAAATTVAAATSTTLRGTSEWSDQATAIHGTFAGSLGRGTYSGTLSHVPTETTDTCGPVCATVTGTITFSGKRGDFTAEVEPGSVVALEDIASHSFRTFTLQLRVTGGTRSYKHADGELVLSYTSTWSHYYDGNGQFVNTIEDEGTLAGNPRQ